jgi:hypothetical protein
MQKTKPVQDEIFEELKRRSAALVSDLSPSVSIIISSIYK